MKTSFCFACLLWGTPLVRAQDFNFVQSLLLPQVVNPAAAGHQSLYRGQVAALYRGQWDNAGSEQSYQGAAAAADLRFCLQNQYKNFFALGLVLQHDWSPLGGLSNTAGQLSGAFHLHLGNETFASAGAYLGALGYRLDPDRLKFNAQYLNGNYNPNAPTGESFSRNGAIKPDLGSGIEVYNNGKGWSTGVAWRHVNKPGYSLHDDDANRLGIGWVVHGSATLGQNKAGARAWLLRGLYRRQSFSGGNSAQWQGLLGAFRQVTYNTGAKTRLTAGAYFRLGGRPGAAVAVNTLIPAVQLGSDNFTAALSYDISLQRTRSRFAGGLELSLAYSFGETDRCVVCRGPGL